MYSLLSDEVVLPQMNVKKIMVRERRKRTSFQKRSVRSDPSKNNYEKNNRERLSTLHGSSSNLYKFPNNEYNNDTNTTNFLSITESVYKESDRNLSSSQRDLLIKSLKRQIVEELNHINDRMDFGESGNLQTRNRRQLPQSVEEVFIPQGLINPFRGITNLALPIINKPPVNLNASKQPARFIKSTEPSPRRPKACFFKNTSSSIDFSGRRDFEISAFFGASLGDSGASGRPVVLLHHGLLSSSANFVLDDAHEALGKTG